MNNGLRFRILKRDGFSCLYCGSKPPDVRLHVDHLRPMASGGKDMPWNLITSCLPCNLGKWAHPVSSVPARILAQLEKDVWLGRHTPKHRRRMKSQGKPPKGCYRFQDAADALGLERRTLLAWSKRGMIKTRKIGKFRFVPISEVERFQ